MGANQSGVAQASSADQVNQSSGILVVNPTPGQQPPECTVNLPERVLPVLSLEGRQIDQTRHRPREHQLNPDLWFEFIVIVNDFAKSRSELTSVRQAHLQEKIAQVDEHVQKFTDSYVNGKHKALARMNEDFQHMDEINKLLEKCTIQSQLCVNMLNKLNFLLPEDLKLEPLEP